MEFSPGRPRSMPQEDQTALSNEENKRDPAAGDDARHEDGVVEEAEGSPVDPSSLENGESPGSPEDPEVEPVTGEDPEWDEATLLSVELEATRKDRDQYLDALRRLKAEFENSRKRQERERIRVLSMASERLGRYPGGRAGYQGSTRRSTRRRRSPARRLRRPGVRSERPRSRYGPGLRGARGRHDHPNLPERLSTQREADSDGESCSCEAGLGYGEVGSLQGSGGIQGRPSG